MRPLHLSLRVESEDPTVILRCIAGLFGLALTQTGASVTELETGDIAMSELVEELTVHTEIREVALSGSAQGFELRLELADSLPTLTLGEGSRQIIDGGFHSWSMIGHDVVITLPLDRQSSDHA